MDESTANMRPQTDACGPVSLESLALKIQAGIEVESAFAELFQRTRRLVRGYFAENGHATHELEDLVQETYLRAFQSLSRYRHESKVSSWLLAIARHVRAHALSHQTALKRQPPEPRSTRPAESWRGPHEPEQRLLASEQVQRIEEQVMAMPGRMRQCVLLRYLEGLSYEEIAATLRISVDNVKVQLFRARIRLKRPATDTSARAAG